MPGEDGFAFLRSIPRENYGIIFITAYQEYALKALKASAIDYLLKPVNPLELREAVTKAIQYYELRQSRAEILKIYHESLDNLHDQIQSGEKPIAKITVTEQFGFRMVNVRELMYLQAYSSFEGNFAELNDGTRLSISRRKLNDFREAVKHFSKSLE